MKTVLNGFIVIVLGVAAAGVSWAQKPSDEHVPGRLLVQAAPGVDDAAAEQIVALVGAKVHHSIDGIGVKVLEVPEQALDGVSLMLQRSGRFTFVERDFVAHGAANPNDPDFTSQWHLSKIQAPSAWGMTTGTGVPIAIIDSGADMTHPDLKPKLLPGWNFLTGNSNVSDTGALGGHGTAVSGAAAAATNNLTGVAGVGWSNMIMPLVVLSSSNYASYSNIASAINYAADHGVRIISISIIGSASSTTLQSAVNYAWNKGAVVFGSAGNNSSSAPGYPAACTNAVAVSSTEPTDTFSSFSNYGSWITLSAPGDLILTTNLGGGYGSWYGTSFSAPIAAGVGALALAENPSLSPSALVTLLKKNSDDLGAPGYDQYFGWGRVNAYRAVQAAKGGTTTADTTAPVVSITSPTSGATVKGTFLVQGTATDNVGVKTIQFYVDSSLVSSAVASPFGFSWNSAGVANGTHTLTVKAYDAANNVGSASVTVNVNNDKTAPTVSIASPTTSATVSGTINVTGTAADNVGVTKVQLFVDGVAGVYGTASPFSFSWNTSTATNAVHTITVKAYDAAGNVGSAAVSLTVKNSSTADTTAPVISILSPLKGATVSGTLSVQGTATDNVGVKTIQFYADSTLVSSIATSPFAFTWNSTAVANGLHTLTLKAYDAANNVGSASVTVNVYNSDKTAPVVSIVSPTTGATVSGTIAVTGSAADNVGVTKVQLFVDGVAIVSGSASSFSFSWNTITATNAVHTVSVKAYDAVGNVGTAAVSVTVKNTGKSGDTRAPVVSITSPIAGATVKGSFMVQGTATDDVGVSKIQFYVDGRLISNLAASPFALSWNSTGVANGTHTLTVKAYDAAQNVGAASVAVNVKN